MITGAKTFSYDSENQFKSMNGGYVTLQYDGDGNRVSETVSGVTTRYLVDDLNPTGYAQVVEELSGGAVQRAYTYGLQRISEDQLINKAWTPSFYNYDGGGTVRQLTSLSGSVTDTYAYDAFGNLLASTGTTPNNYLYRGEQYDTSLDLYYLRARYMNPVTGRFLSRDPAEGASRLPATLHKYLYVGENPVRFVDPLGKGTSDYAGAGAIALSAVVDLGQKVDLQGTIEVSEGTAMIYVQSLEGVVTQGVPGVLALFQEAATALGASEMYIVATIANSQLNNILLNRYAWVQVGGQVVWYQKF